MFIEVGRRSRVKLAGFVKYRQRSCLLKCNREVPWISSRDCVYTRVTDIQV